MYTATPSFLVKLPEKSLCSSNLNLVGFLEGGEFNALVSMKVLNKEKMTDIKAS